MHKHAVEYHRIGNPPEEFPANCILLDKGNGLRKFGLSRKRDQTRRTIRRVELWLCPSLAEWTPQQVQDGAIAFVFQSLIYTKHQHTMATGSWPICKDGLEPV